jgi:hypothetical protein
MNSTQIQSTLTPIVGFVAGILAAKFAWFDSATWTAILMGVVGLGATVWGALATRNNAVISQAASLCLKCSRSSSSRLLRQRPSRQRRPTSTNDVGIARACAAQVR